MTLAVPAETFTDQRKEYLHRLHAIQWDYRDTVFPHDSQPFQAEWDKSGTVGRSGAFRSPHTPTPVESPTAYLCMRCKCRGRGSNPHDPLGVPGF